MGRFPEERFSYGVRGPVGSETHHRLLLFWAMSFIILF
jgi:hypothetical protein